MLQKLYVLHQEYVAWFYFKRGEATRGVNLFEKVIPEYYMLFKVDLNEYDECFSPVHYHFGMIYNYKNEYDKAKIEFKKAIKAGGPQNVFGKRSKKELEKFKN